MRDFLTIIMLMLWGLTASSQDSTVVIMTDSSTIKIHYYENVGKLVEEYYNNKNLVHIVSYYEDNLTIARDSYTDKTRQNQVGIARNYDENGELRITIDYDNRQWYPADTSRYPHFKLLNRMKLKADSIVKELYCEDFVETHLKWNIGGSYYFDRTYSQPSFSISWLRDNSYKYQPTEFYVSYDFYESGIKHEKAIKVLFDLEGRLLTSHKWNNHWTINNEGLEKFEGDTCKVFELSVDDAIKLARKEGLNYIDTANAYGFLKWVGSGEESSKIFNGVWRIYVLNPKDIDRGETTSDFVENVKQYYEVYIFNPWTGKFLEKKLMYREYRAERGITIINNQLIEDN